MRIQLLCLALMVGCVDGSVDGDGRDDTFTSDGKADVNGIEEGSPAAVAVLSIVNSSTELQLHDDVGLSVRAASGIASYGSISTLSELDDIPYVGPIAFGKLVAYAEAQGLITADTGTTTPIGTGILLDCNTSLGPDQQVTVIGDGTSLKLRELTTSGGQVDRPLSASEWGSKKLRLRDDGFGSTATLAKEMGDWMMRSGGGGVSEIGVADCWVDKSH